MWMLNMFYSNVSILFLFERLLIYLMGFPTSCLNLSPYDDDEREIDKHYYYSLQWTIYVFPVVNEIFKGLVHHSHISEWLMFGDCLRCPLVIGVTRISGMVSGCKYKWNVYQVSHWNVFSVTHLYKNWSGSIIG